jgi:hypothetical protein
MLTRTRLDEELRAAADRLTAEFSDTPAGSVLRCFSRAVHAARLDHIPPEQLPAAGEAIARQMLLLRAGPRVPQQRRPHD